MVNRHGFILSKFIVVGAIMLKPHHLYDANCTVNKTSEDNFLLLRDQQTCF